MTERLKKCIEAGDVLALFPLLSKWPKSELRALLDDIGSFCQEAQRAIDEIHRSEALKVENFFSATRSKRLDREREQSDIDLVALCSEIASVALYYLGEEAG